jgi:hypothetical protein
LGNDTQDFGLGSRPHMQQRHSDLFFVNEEYEQLINERVDYFYEGIKQIPEISGLIRLARVLQMSDPESEDLITTQNELREWLIEFRAERSQAWDENYDPALITEHEAMMRAIGRVISEISPLPTGD